MVMDRAEVKLFGKWTWGSRRIWIRGRGYICLRGILHFLAVDLGAGAQSSETLSSLGLTLQKESGVDTNRYPEN